MVRDYAKLSLWNKFWIHFYKLVGGDPIEQSLSSVHSEDDSTTFTCPTCGDTFDTNESTVDHCREKHPVEYAKGLELTRLAIRSWMRKNKEDRD